MPETQPDTTLKVVDGDHIRAIFIDGERYLGERDVASLRDVVAGR